MINFDIKIRPNFNAFPGITTIRFLQKIQCKSLVSLGAALLLSASVFAQQPTANAQPTIMPRAPDINATSYILMDAATGAILAEHESDLPLPPASLTKIMTTYVAEVELENGNITLDDQVHVSVKAWRAEGSKMFIQEGTTVRLEDLMRGIIIQSGNDASIAIAEHIAGSEEAFADMMNQHAELLGMTSSHFTNSSGLPDAEHLMSAHDLALLSQRIINHFPQHYAIYGEREFTYNEIRQPNRNTLLFRDQNVDGMKTGYTEEAGYCLVASAIRDDMRLIAVVLGTASTEARATEAQKLMTYGFRFYETRDLLTAGQQLASQKIWGGNTNAVNIGVPEDVVVTIPRAAGDSLETVLEVDEIIKAPIEAGQVMGTVRVTSGEEVLYEGPVVALEAVEKGSIFKRLMDWLHLFFLGLFS